MCTFKITNDSTELLIDQYLKDGGPTESRTVELDGIYITHHLLNITGEITPQPIYYGGKYFMLIGEFYNYDDSWPSDIYFGIEKYNEYNMVINLQNIWMVNFYSLLLMKEKFIFSLTHFLQNKHITLKMVIIFILPP